ncbi:hypothetical protein RN001_001886 [Aquatica leii]|uniref:Ig-like domain-containing protein n=1 Tax=Aquatica leii TaxID=1421715 RepID=A0AAN7SSQ7_9COLE|nr:hypothetical protein RN001_001886 [Aquatica leii]
MRQFKKDLRNLTCIANAKEILQNIRHGSNRKEFITGQRRNSKFDASFNAILSESDNIKTSEKLFLSPNYTIVQAQVGTTAVLHCEVVDIGESTVSWIRKHDYHLLTVGLQTYSSDKRFFTSTGKNGQDWCLHIRYSELKDSGLYECQVTTHPASSLFVELQLVEAHADIIGGSEKIVKSGSPLRLSCVLRRSTEPPEYIFWYHGDRMINYDLKGGAAVRHGRQGSELIIPRAEMKHAGNYSCVPSNARSVNVTVHVLQSEKPAAMQHDSKGGSTIPYKTNDAFTKFVIYFFYILYLKS